MTTKNNTSFSALIGQTVPPLFEMSSDWMEALCEIDGSDVAPNFYGLAWPARDEEEGFPLHDEIMMQLNMLHLDLDEAVGSVFTYRPQVGVASASCINLVIELDLDGSLIVIDADIETGHSDELELTVGLSRPAAALSMYRSLKACGVLNPPLPLGVSDVRLSQTIISAADTLRDSISDSVSLIDEIDLIASLSLAASLPRAA